MRCLVFLIFFLHFASHTSMQSENWTDRNWQLTIIFSAVCIIGGYTFITAVFPQAKNFFFLSNEKKNILAQLKSRPNLTHEDFHHKFVINEEFSESNNRGKGRKDGDKQLKQRKVLKSLETSPPYQLVTLPSTITIPEKKQDRVDESKERKTGSKSEKSSKTKLGSKWTHNKSGDIRAAQLNDPVICSATLRAEQDREYEECLRKDLERQQIEEHIARRKKEISESIPAEPNAEEENSVLLCLRIKDPLTAVVATTKVTNLKSVKRRFLRTHAVQQLLDYLESLALRPLFTPLQIAFGHPPRSFSLHAVSSAEKAVGSEGSHSTNDTALTLEEVGIKEDSVVWVIFPQD